MITESGTRGVTILEVLFSLLILAVVVPVGWMTLARCREAGMRVAGRAEMLETVRTVAWVVPEEVSRGRANLDWRIFQGDSLSIRAFRALGLVKGGAAQGGWIQVCCVGHRDPTPGKDSVLVLSQDGRWRKHDLLARKALSQGCPGMSGGQQEGWQLSPPSTDAVIGRVYERGSYYFLGGAFRYRRGAGGKQPLTAERIESGRFFGPTDHGAPLGWMIQLRADSMAQVTPRGDSLRSWWGGGW